MKKNKHNTALMMAVFVGSCALLAMSSHTQAASVTLIDTIAISDRTNFNGFEGLPEGVPATDWLVGATYTEDAITVTQINGNSGISILSNYDPGGIEGARSWYPQGGDYGYTQITRVGGGDFFDVGVHVGSGNANADYMLYALYDNGVEILAGELSHAKPFYYLGFLGGGFDEIRLRDSIVSGATFLDTNLNALAIDSIELANLSAIPLPASLPLFLSGLAGLGFLGHRRKKLRPSGRRHGPTPTPTES